jgi:hypothetical protein
MCAAAAYHRPRSGGGAGTPFCPSRLGGAERPPQPTKCHVRGLTEVWVGSVLRAGPAASSRHVRRLTIGRPPSGRHFPVPYLVLLFETGFLPNPTSRGSTLVSSRRRRRSCQRSPVVALSRAQAARRHAAVTVNPATRQRTHWHESGDVRDGAAAAARTAVQATSVGSI